MKKFLVTFFLPEVLDVSFYDVLPEHREYINTLLREEVIVTYSVNTNRTKGWVILNAYSADEVRQYIENFPIYDKITYEIDELFLFDSTIGLPKVVLN